MYNAIIIIETDSITKESKRKSQMRITTFEDKKKRSVKNGKNFKTADNPSYKTIMNSLKNAKLKCYVIDDSQYLMAFDFFNKSKEVGYQKFTEIGYNFEQLIRTVQTDTPHDCIVYFLHHTEQMPNGSLKAKTIGKMLDEK